MSAQPFGTRFSAAMLLLSAIALPALTTPARAAPDPGCPGFGWAEGLGQYLPPNAAFPTDDTRNLNTPDCIFHQWSWEAFVWATALVNGPGGAKVPRFMTLATPDQLLRRSASAGPPVLQLGARSHVLRGQAGFTEGAGAIVEADGNMMVAQNGYPVYASVHMNPSYFNTARQNLIIDGGYQKGDPGRYFNVGAAVFKATWLRLDPGQQAPAGAYVTQAQVPVLTTSVRPGQVTILPVPNKFVTVPVALVGLHVVGYTVNHPEFLWGTFEHQLNTPATADNTFTPSASISDPRNYTFYKAGTPYSQVNIAVAPPQLRLDEKTQKISPVTNAVLENATGGENHPNGADNIKAINSQAKGSVGNFPVPQNQFASYNLIGTVWMQPNSYNLQSNQNSATGSISLANVTAETFFQAAKNSPASNVQNCFTCHNPTSYNFQTPPPPKLAPRLIALSHVLAYGSVYAVPNSISGNLVLGGRPKAAQ